MSNGIEGHKFHFYVISAAPEEVVQAALEGIVPPTHIFGTGREPYSVAVGDFNLDGKSDLVTANQNSNNVSVLLNGCTSNTPPTISALSVTRAAGSPAGSSQIATVNDIQDAESALVVTATPLSGSGVTLSISVDASGNVTAAAIAACGATASTFTLRVTDSGSLFAETTLTITVTANPPGLQLVNNAGIYVLQGTPTVRGTFSFTLLSKARRQHATPLPSGEGDGGKVEGERERRRQIWLAPTPT